MNTVRGEGLIGESKANLASGSGGYLTKGDILLSCNTLSLSFQTLRFLALSYSALFQQGSRAVY